MEKELVQMYKEYDKLSTALPNMRNEHNFLIESIEKKRKELGDVSRLKLEESESIQIKRMEFDNYVNSKNSEINIDRKRVDSDLKAEQEKIYRLIEELKKKRESASIEREATNKESVEFSAYLLKENNRIKKELEVLDKKEKDMLLLQDKLALEESKVKSLIASNNSSIVLAKEMVSDAIAKQKKAEELYSKSINESEKLVALRSYIESKEDEIIERWKAIDYRIKDLESKEKWIIKKELEIKERETSIKDKEYNLECKEEDLKAEEKRLVLLSKQLKNG